MNLRDRVINILKSPRQEWDVIAQETTDTATLYKGYIIPLAAIPVIASFIGMVTIGVPTIVGSIRVSPVRGLANAVVSYVFALIGIYVAALVIDWLAPKFQSEKSVIQALKLVAYSMTPAWIAGVLMLIPFLGILAIIGGLYGIYLFYLGMTPMMKTPSDKVIPYMVVSAVVVILVQIVIGVLVNLVTPAYQVPAVF